MPLQTRVSNIAGFLQQPQVQEGLIIRYEDSDDGNDVHIMNGSFIFKTYILRSLTIKGIVDDILVVNFDLRISFMGIIPDEVAIKVSPAFEGMEQKACEDLVLEVVGTILLT